MLVKVLNEIPEDPDLSEAWNSLVLGMENPEVFLTYQWALAAGRGFQSRLSPRLFLLYEAEQLMGVAALALDPDAPQALFFLTSSTADYCDVVSAPATRRQVLHELLNEIRRLGFRDMVFANVPANSATLDSLAAAAGPQRFYVTSRPAYNCGVVELSGEEQREALLQNLTAKSREKRALKRLTNLGAVKVIHLTEAEQIGPSVESIISAQISRFLASERVSPLVGSERRAFLRHLGNLLSQSGWLKISQLEINDRPVAWNYGFRFGGSWFWYLPTFQMDYEHVSPGSCLLRLLVEQGAKDSSLSRLDLGLGDEAYKDRFANKVRQTRYVHITRGMVRHALSTARESLSSLAARHPALGDKLRRARDFIGAAIVRVQDMGAIGTMRFLGRKLTKSLASEDEVLLFEASAVSTDVPSRLVRLTREHLVEASILYPSDRETLRYLMRCARRLNQRVASGFVLSDDSGQPVHFLWMQAYDGFRLDEIDYTLEANMSSATMIFDCWTPSARRGHGYYAAALRQAAAQLRREGKSPWIFSGARNQFSWRGILKAGFEYRFSLIRRSRFGHSTVVGRDVTAAFPQRPATIPPKSVPARRDDIAVNS